MARQADLRALCNMIEQAYLAVGSDPIPTGAATILSPARPSVPGIHHGQRIETSDAIAACRKSKVHGAELARVRMVIVFLKPERGRRPGGGTAVGIESCRENLRAALALATMLEDQNRVSIRE
jgi:hypothetical protein